MLIYFDRTLFKCSRKFLSFTKQDFDKRKGFFFKEYDTNFVQIIKLKVDFFFEIIVHTIIMVVIKFKYHESNLGSYY
jgi:hypothetical protein